MKRELPTWAARALRLALPEDWADDIVRDLGEEYGAQLVRSPFAARLWLAREVITFALRFLVADVAERVTSLRAEPRGWALELKQATRAIGRRPGVPILVVATTAIAVGATTAVFSVVNGVLLRPLPYPKADALVRIYEVHDEWLNSPVEARRSVADRLDPLAPIVRRWLQSDLGLESLGAYVDASFYVQVGSRLDVVRGQEATSGFFDALQMAPLVGRPIQPSDDLEGAPRVVVLNERYWQLRFDGREDALGQSVVIDRQPHEIVGVMPADFGSQLTEALSPQVPSEVVALWTPLTREAYRGWKSTPVVGRMASGADLSVVRERLSAAQRHLSEERAAADDSGVDPRQRSARVVGLLDSVVGGVSSTLLFLLGTVLLVLAVATLNIAGVLTARGLERGRQTALQAALGASRLRLVRSQFTESALLGLTGGLLGVTLTVALLPRIMTLLPPSLPRTSEVALDFRVLLWALAVTLISTCIGGSVPALLLSGASPQAALSAVSRSTTHSRFTQRLRSGVVIAEIAAAFLLLAAAGLFSSSYLRLWSQDRGFDTEGLVALWIDPDTRDEAEYRSFVSSIRSRLETLPGVSTTAANNLPLAGGTSGTRVLIEQPGGEAVESRGLLTVGLPNYPEVLGIPLFAGRTFSTLDRAGSPLVAMVNQTMARTNWPEGDAIGQRIQVDGSDSIEIVGVLADTKHAGLASAADATVFLPAAQSNRDTNEWILRVRGNIGSTLRAARSAVASISPTSPVVREIVLDQRIQESVAIPRIRTQLVLGLAILSAVLALIGVYGALAFSVAQNTKEIGLRMALGARRSRVVGSVLARGLVQAAVGIGLGAILLWGCLDTLRPFLFDAPASPLLLTALVAAGLLATTLLGALFPARRAASVDPNQALTTD